MLKIRYVTAVLALATMLSGAAFAQQTNVSGAPGNPPDATATGPTKPPVTFSDPCSKVKGTISGTDLTGGNGTPAQTTGGDDEDGGGFMPAPTENPKPNNPVNKTCAGGLVRMTVGITPADEDGNPASHRHFGHTIMDKIPLTVLLNLDPSVTVDLTSLVKQHVLGFDGSDFNLYKPQPGEPPAVTITGPLLKQVGVRPDPDNPGKMLPVLRKVVRIDLIVTTMVYKPRTEKDYNVVFNLDLRFANEFLPDGKTPNWTTMTTPDFPVTFSRVGDNGEKLQEGDLSDKGTRLPWPTIALLALGVFLALLPPGIAAVKWVNRVRPRKLIPANRMAWNVFESNYKDGKKNGFKVKHLKAFAHALRRYLATLPAYTRIDALTIEQIATHFPDADQAQVETILRAVRTCEKEIFAAGAERNGETAISLSADELKQLFNDLQVLVPRPWDAK